LTGGVSILFQPVILSDLLSLCVSAPLWGSAALEVS
jgi:hypothetical protein